MQTQTSLLAEIYSQKEFLLNLASVESLAGNLIGFRYIWIGLTIKNILIDEILCTDMFPNNLKIR